MGKKFRRNLLLDKSLIRMLFCFIVMFSCVFFVCCGKDESEVADIEEPIESYCVPAQTYEIDEQQNTESYEYINLCSFLKNKMMDNYAVHTHYLPSKSKKDYATGYDILSESQGLLMDIAINENDEQTFYGAFSFVNNNMVTDNGIGFRYAVDGSLDMVNATVDDLRIIGALLRGYDMFENGYYDIAVQYSNSFLKTNVVDGYIVDYFEQNNMTKADFITLCYLDFDTLSRLSEINDEYDVLYENMLSIAEEGYLGDDLPLYQTRYNYRKSKYETERINMVECVLTMVHLAEAGRLERNSIEYIKGLVDEGVVYSVYKTDGTKKTNEESTAVYGLIALLAKALDDEQLYDKSIELMKQYQVMDETSEVYGGFADEQSLQAFSFDNLIALLAFSEG